MIPFLTGLLVGCATWALSANVLAPIVGWPLLILALASATGLWGYLMVMDGAPDA